MSRLTPTHYGGYRPVPPDPRNWKLAHTAAHATILPQGVDLRPLCGPIRDQGGVGACTGFAGAACRELLVNRWHHSQHEPLSQPWEQLSPLFLYFQDRLEDGLPTSEDSGASIQAVCQALRDYGCALESTTPYPADPPAQQQAIKVPPSAEAYRTAESYGISGYFQCGATQGQAQFDAIVASLNDSVPVLIGFGVLPSFEQAPASGVIPLPTRWEHYLGGHAGLLVGYRRDPRLRSGIRFIDHNSWGTSWGDAGYGYLPGEYVLQGIVQEAFACV